MCDSLDWVYCLGLCACCIGLVGLLFGGGFLFAVFMLVFWCLGASCCWVVIHTAGCLCVLVPGGLISSLLWVILLMGLAC